MSLPSAGAVKFYYDHESHWATDNRSSVIAVAPGSFQSELGCPADWDPTCLRSWLEDPDGDGTYTFETTALPAGSYETKVAINEDWTENYGQGGVLNGSNVAFNVPVDNTKVTFSYDAASHVLTVTVATPAGAPGWPGTLSHFDLARKDCLGTARNSTSKVWYTVANGVLSDVYYPTIDNTNVETLQYVVTDGSTFTDLQTRDMTYVVEAVPETGGMVCRVTARAKSGKYTIETEYLTDPARNTVLMNVRLEPKRGYRLYVRFDPTVNGNGGGGVGNGGADSATVDRTAGHPVLVASDPITATNAANRDYAQPVYVALDGALTEATSGFAGSASDGLVQLDAAHALTRTDDDASGGNVVQTARVAIASNGKTKLALGFGASQAQAVAHRGGLAQPVVRQGARRVQGGVEALRRVAEQAAHREAQEPHARRAEAGRGRVLPERERAQGLRGQDLPRRDRREPRLAVGTGGLGRRPGEHLLRLLPRGVRARSLRDLDRPRRGRRHRHGARRDALPLRASAAARRVDASEQPRQRQAGTRLVRDAAGRGRVPDPDGAAARAHRRRAVREPHQAGRELPDLARPGVRIRALGGTGRLLALDDRGRDRGPRRGGRPCSRQRRHVLRRPLARGRRRLAALGEGLDGDDERAAGHASVLHPALEDG